MSDPIGSLYSFDPDTILSKYDNHGLIDYYLQLLLKENEKVNLVSRETSAVDLKRLAAESLLPIEKLDLIGFQKYLDIGSGGGLPALPIVVALNLGKATLVERTQKKAVALRRMILELKLEAQVIDQNFEEVKFEERFDLITLRLIRLSPRLLKRIEQLLSPTGVFVYYSDFENSEATTNLLHKTYSYKVFENSPTKSFTIFRTSEQS